LGALTGKNKLMEKEIDFAGTGAVNDRVYDALRRQLTSGFLQPGQAISIRYLTDLLKISATPAREAIKRLVAEHALVIGPNRTPIVPILTRADLRDLRDIRLALEGMATERAAAMMTLEDLSFLKKLCEEMETAIKENNFDQYLESNWRFHRSIYRVSSSPYMMSIIENLWMRAGPHLRLIFLEASAIGNSMGHHRQALQALARGDGVGARIAIEADISGAASDIEGVLQ
jgi:DNA-binding GntR family transcriptional regulator